MNIRQKSILISGIVAVIMLILSGIYLIFNWQYMPEPVRSSNKLWDPNGTMGDRQKELQNVGYFNNGKEQGYLDARCNSWLCSYSVNETKWRGTVANPVTRLKINGDSLTKENKMYYNSGYIKSYAEICSRYRADCEARIQNMKTDYQKYFDASLYDIDKNNNFILVK